MQNVTYKNMLKWIQYSLKKVKTYLKIFPTNKKLISHPEPNLKEFKRLRWST